MYKYIYGVKSIIYIPFQKKDFRINPCPERPSSNKHFNYNYTSKCILFLSRMSGSVPNITVTKEFQ